MADFLFRGSLKELDPDVFELTELETARQVNKLILIPSESQAPLAVREALSSSFQNIYAEGYPDEETRSMVEGEILDYETRLGFYRRFSDPRYYKGVEYADILEALARRRCAEAFAANGISADEIFVNVQALSGAPANNAVYHALINPGETMMGMNLLHGGHLSHGSSVNRSGKFYNAVHYTINPETGKIDYDQIEELALKNKPKFIIAGYSSYPWSIDWLRFRQIADKAGAYLFADIAHVAGLVAGGAYPSPVGFADVITFTTHKSLCGPRGACILTTNQTLARKIDRAVFPGEQGGPHVNVFAAMALTFKLAKTVQFQQLQRQIVKNCAAFTERLREHGFRIPFGGTDTHLMNLDCSSITGPDGAGLSGDQAARILDIAGIVVNRNTIPGDKNSADPSGIRMGTPWVTQRGFDENRMVTLADLISDLLKACTPYYQETGKNASRRSKIDFSVLEETKLQVRDLALSAGADIVPEKFEYPHFYYLDAKPDGISVVFELSGERIRSFMNYAFSSDVEILKRGESQVTRLYTPRGQLDGMLSCVDPYRYRVSFPADSSGVAAAWLRDLSDGYVMFDDDPLRKLPGPVHVSKSHAKVQPTAEGEPVSVDKPYFCGTTKCTGEPVPPFSWIEAEPSLRRTPLYEIHKQQGAKIIPFAGWEMPVWYSSVVEEHLAVRQAAGIFDVTHMGVYQVEGPDAVVFLDSLVGNDIGLLDIGQSCYTHLLTPDADVIDDLLVYRRSQEIYLVVVNASNDDKNWTWMNAVKNGEVLVSNARPCARSFGRNAVLRNLRDPKSGEDMRLDIALQGPRSRDILLALGVDELTRQKIMLLKRTELCDAVVGGFDLVVSRTGYTGEKMAFELFVHPQNAAELFTALLKTGEPFGIKPVGLGARDSLRTEAGLPLYGHEMGLGSGHRGHADLGVAEAGFGSYVKSYKPWFVGREAYLERSKSQNGIVIRFRFNEKGVRMAHNSDPVLDLRGRVIGWVTSCAVDSQGFLTGQAFVDLKNAEEGAEISIFQSASDKAGKAPAEFNVGDRANIPTPATIISRFPK